MLDNNIELEQSCSDGIATSDSGVKFSAILLYDLPFQIPFDHTFAEKVFLVLNNPLSLSNNSFAANTEFFFFNLQLSIISNSTSSLSHSSSGLLTISDQ